MGKRVKSVRTKGKIPLSRYFKEFDEGDRVAIVRERSVRANFPERLQGRTGIVKGKRGKSCIVTISDMKKGKSHIVEPVHLKKIKNAI